MNVLRALASGIAGAGALTLIHESARRMIPNAPRADVLGMRAIDKIMRKGDFAPPPDDRLHQWALAGDLVGNSLYYGLVGVGSPRGAWLRGGLLGLGAGLGAVALPGPLGLGEGPSGRTNATKAMTVAWYLAGGLVAAAVASWMGRGEE
jgi:hypothetical protein